MGRFKPKLLIIGAGEYGQLVKEIARNKYPVIDFLDDDSQTVVGKINDMAKYLLEYDVIVAIEDSEKRAELFNRLEVLGFRIATIISPRSYVSKSAVIEAGCVIEPMSVVHFGARVRRGTFVCTGAVVNHHAFVDEFCQINCNAVVGADVEVPSGFYIKP